MRRTVITISGWTRTDMDPHGSACRLIVEKLIVGMLSLIVRDPELCIDYYEGGHAE